MRVLHHLQDMILIDVVLRLSLRQGHDGIKPWLGAHDTGDVALARQVFGE